MRRNWILVVLALVAFPVIGLALYTSLKDLRVGGHELEVLGDLPDFTLRERSGKSVDLDDLKGKVWVAGFIFTHCGGQCPLISAQMERLQQKLKTRKLFRLVSISVDPERDTPPVLADYARHFDADPNHWLFLTGPKKQIHSLVREGFHLSAEPKMGDIIHSAKLVLIDEKGRIRGYYDGTDAASVDTLAADAQHLLHHAS